MELDNVPEPFQSRLKELYENFPFGEEVNDAVIQCEDDATTWNEAHDMLFNDFQARIDEAIKIQNYLCKE